MKKFLLSLSIVCFCTGVFAQATLTVIPETPLVYLGYEITSPTLKTGYTKRVQNFITQFGLVQAGLILQKKYMDLPIYQFFSEKTELFGSLESQTTVSKTSTYVAYVLQARQSSSDPYVTYAKDTFFLSGTTITSISETIYDTDDNSVNTYAQYDVDYHSNGKIEKIELKNTYSGSDLYFAGVSVVYNANNTLKTDTLYAFGYTDTGDRKVKVSIYQDHTYKASDALKIDSTFYNQIGSTPVQNTKFTYTLNTANEVTQAQVYTYSSSSNSYENITSYDFGQEPGLGVLSQSTVSTVVLYPNPVQDLINIPADCSFQSWSITSLTGLTIKAGNNSDLNKISVTDLKAGVYVLTLSSNEQTWTGKFIK